MFVQNTSTVCGRKLLASAHALINRWALTSIRAERQFAWLPSSRYYQSGANQRKPSSFTNDSFRGYDNCRSYATYTTDAKPGLKRNRSFKELSAEDVAFFRDVLGSDRAIIDGVTKDATDDLASFNIDWMKKYRGESQLVLKPETTDQVSKILRYCNDNLLAVNPQGGNSGLAGGSVPVFDEIVLNLSRMNSIRSFDDTSGVLVADAGVILQDADQHLMQHGYIFPLDLGAKGSCQIGGNVATNAGGLRLLRYGSLHGNVLGLEIVLPDGTIINDLCELRKNNTGYDLKHLFIGGEGTNGIITAVSIQCPQRSPAVNVAYFGLDSFDAVLLAFRKAKTYLSEILSAFELMDFQSQRIYSRATGSKLPLESEYPFYCLIETSGSSADHDSEKLSSFLEHVLQEGVVADGVLAQDESQIQSLWACREGISEASQHFGGVYKYDVSIPLPRLYGLVEDTRRMFETNGLMGQSEECPVIDVVGYGHMGDCNLHLNVATRRYDSQVEQALEPFVFEWIQRHHGSISAEHGLGLAKKDFVKYSKSETMMRLMSQIKQLYDPVSTHVSAGASHCMQEADLIIERHHESVQIHLIHGDFWRRQLELLYGIEVMITEI
jgi:FAD/FMN-containing dehydrogenase